MEMETENRLLGFSKDLTESGAVFWDDTLILSAEKASLPMASDWKYSPILKSKDTGNFTPSGDRMQWIPLKKYELDHTALKSKIGSQIDPTGILKNIRLEIIRKSLKIIFNGILLEKAKTSRLKLAIESLKALNRAGILGQGVWTSATAKTYGYTFLKNHFKVSEYHVRFDSGRYGAAFYRKCRKNSEWTVSLAHKNRKSGGTFNQVSFYSPNKEASRKRGFQIVCYDRHKKSENRKSDSSLFPIRLEIKLYTRALPGAVNETIRGNGQDIIRRVQETIQKLLIDGISKMKAKSEFEIFAAKKKSFRPLKETVHELIQKGSLLQAMEKMASEVAGVKAEVEGVKASLAEYLEYHGKTLPHRRGLKVV